MLIDKDSNDDNQEQPTQEEKSENLRFLVLEIMTIQSKLLSLRNNNREILNEVSKESILNNFETKDLEPADLLVAQFSQIEEAAMSLLKNEQKFKRET